MDKEIVQLKILNLIFWVLVLNKTKKTTKPKKNNKTKTKKRKKKFNECITTQGIFIRGNTRPGLNPKWSHKSNSSRKVHDLIDPILQIITVLQSKADVANAANLIESIEILESDTVTNFLNRAYDDTNYTLAKDVLDDVKTNFEEARAGTKTIKEAFDTNRGYYNALVKIGEKVRNS